MTTRLPSIRGRKALILLEEEREVGVLVRQLYRLGVEAEVPPPGASGTSCADIVFLDTDAAPGVFDDTLAALGQRPLVAVVGTESPSRLECVLDRAPCAVLMKPIRSSGIYTALVVAFHEDRRRRSAEQKMERLEERIRCRRIVFAAIMRLMREYGIEEPEAYRLLRNTAQELRTTIEHLSVDIADGRRLPVRLVARG